MIKASFIGARETVRAFNKMGLKAGLRVRGVVNTNAMRVERGAKLRCPVDTGRLRSSIATEFYRSGLAAEVGTEVHYAPHVEYGTGRRGMGSMGLAGLVDAELVAAYSPSRAGQEAQPFLFPAWEEVRPQYIEDLATAMQRSVAEVALTGGKI